MMARWTYVKTRDGRFEKMRETSQNSMEHAIREVATAASSLTFDRRRVRKSAMDSRLNARKKTRRSKGPNAARGATQTFGDVMMYALAIGLFLGALLTALLHSLPVSKAQANAQELTQSLSSVWIKEAVATHSFILPNVSVYLYQSGLYGNHARAQSAVSDLAQSGVQAVMGSLKPVPVYVGMTLANPKGTPFSSYLNDREVPFYVSESTLPQRTVRAGQISTNLLSRTEELLVLDVDLMLSLAQRPALHHQTLLDLTHQIKRDLAYLKSGANLPLAFKRQLFSFQQAVWEAVDAPGQAGIYHQELVIEKLAKAYVRYQQIASF